MVESLATYRGAVYPWHCDHMGHMNVMWYVGKFDEATWNLFAAAGMTSDFMHTHGSATAGVEQNIVYKKELMPGDVILTGTPQHSRSIDPGDTIEVEITNLGRLRCDVVSAPAPRAAHVGHPPMDTPEVRRVSLGFDERVREDLLANYRAAAALTKP